LEIAPKNSSLQNPLRIAKSASPLHLVFAVRETESAMLARAAQAPLGGASTGSRHRRPSTLSSAIARRRSSSLTPRRRRRQSRCAASAEDNNGGSNSDDNDLAYVAKLAVLSFAGAAAIKYGSLLVSLPHEPSLPVALFVVLGTPVAYSAWLLTRR
jgi:hypothetical protein